MHIGLEVEKKMIKMIQQKKNDTTAMATAINEIYIEWWHDNCFLVGDRTLVGRGEGGIMKIKFLDPGGLNPSPQEGKLWGGSWTAVPTMVV